MEKSKLENEVSLDSKNSKKKKSIIAPILLSFGLGTILGGAYVFDIMKDESSKLIENLTTPDSTGTTRFRKYFPLSPNALAEKDTIYVKGKDGISRPVVRVRGGRGNDHYYEDYSDWESDTLEVEAPGKDGQNRRYTVWKNDDGDYTGDFEDWAVDTVFVPTSNEQDKKRIADLEKQLGQNIKTIIPKKIKIPGKDGKWMYVRNIFLTGNNEYQGQLEGLIPDTIKVKGADGKIRYVHRRPGSTNYESLGDFEDWAVDTVFVPTSNPKDKKNIENLEAQIIYLKNLKTVKPDTIYVKGKDGISRPVHRISFGSDSRYYGDFEDWAVDTVYVATKDPRDEKKINNLEGQLAYWKNIKSKTQTDTIQVEAPGKDGQNRRYTVWKNDDGDYTGDFEDWAVDTVFVPTSNEAMKDTLNYWKGLYRNKKGDLYKSQINLNGLNLKVNPNTKIYKTNGGK